MYSGTTSHYNLPQYAANDVPSILVDMNGAYEDIDTAIYNVASTAATAETKADSAEINATSALSAATAAQSDATQALSDAAAAQSDATQAISDAGAAQTDATQALTDAATALSTAQSASTAATNALSTATSASTTASQASTDAATAISNASAASTAAGNAQADATSALNLLGNTALPTVAQTVTGAVDEIVDEIGNTTLTTTAQTLTGAIEEVKGIAENRERKVIATGTSTTTYSDLFNSLWASISALGLTLGSLMGITIEYGNVIYSVDSISSNTTITLSGSVIEDNNKVVYRRIVLKQTNSLYDKLELPSGTYVDNSALATTSSVNAYL